ncbi:type IV pilin protein [Pseudomonas oryzihabitans]|uniref:Pilus assembly protein PilE n=1 Tax=Pseudomonas oryzihabitans TaxID=47885 RepID=A0A2Z5AAB9_9PSED|nr:type IV pilin protein [Pseudomonas oryzihabitans]AXA67775.1 pilus assembly protein PilE [Pseudomonas oryzihabitans]
MRARGFTLIELMVVVAVVGILAAIAYPSYQTYVLRSNRSEGQALLNEAAARMERFYAQNNAYPTAISGLSIVNNKTASGSTTVLSSSGYYQLSMAVNGTGTTAYTNNGPYLLTAIRSSIQTRDTICGDLTLNAQGVRGLSNNS